MESDTKATLLDIVKGGVVTALLFLAFARLPLVGMVAGLFVPFPALFCDFKRGKTAGAAVVALAALLTAAAEGPAAALLFFLAGGSLSLVLPRLLERCRNTSGAVALAVAIVAVLFALVAGGYALIGGVDVHGQIEAAVRANIAQTVALYEGKGLSGDELGALKDAMVQAGGILAQVYPALLCVGVTMVAVLNLLLLRRMAGRLNRPVKIEPFRTFRNPDHLVWVAIAAGFALLLKQEVVAVVSLNLLIVSGFLYFLQGMAVVISFFSRYAVPALFRYLFYGLLVVQAYLVIAVALVGLFDLWGDFRRPKPQKNL